VPALRRGGRGEPGRLRHLHRLRLVALRLMARKSRTCRSCGGHIEGYVDECPHCGADRPLPIPRHYYIAGLIVLVLIFVTLADFSLLGRLLGG